MNEDRLRQDLERELPDLTQGEWELLDKDGHIEDVLSGPEDVNHLVRRVNRLRAAVQGRKRAEPDAGAMLRGRARAERYEVLSTLLASEAADDPDVRDFRRRVLRGRTLTWERIEAWIERNSGPPTVWSAVPTVEGKRGKAVSRRVEALDYSTPDSQSVQRKATTVGRSLERLRQLSQRLAARYGWQPAQATVFVLTGITPLIEPVRCRFEHRHPVTAASRIILEVDPVETPERLSSIYREVRKSVLSGRYRSMGEKHLRLAAFITECTEGTWDERRQKWNKSVNADSMRYGHTTNFQRDAVTATRRLLEPPLE